MKQNRWTANHGTNGLWSTPDDYPCEASYTPLKEFIEFCNTAYDKDFEAGLTDNIYEQNLIDYHVFCLAQGLERQRDEQDLSQHKGLERGQADAHHAGKP